MKARNSFIRKISALLICLSILLSTIPAGLSIVMAEEDSDLSSGSVVETPVVTATPEATAGAEVTATPEATIGAEPTTTPEATVGAEPTATPTPTPTVSFKVVEKNNSGAYIDIDAGKEINGRTYYSKGKNVPWLMLIVNEPINENEVEILSAIATDLNGATVDLKDTLLVSWGYRKADGSIAAKPTFANNRNEHVMLIKLDKEADYTFKFKVLDPSNSTDANKKYVTIEKKVTIDNTAPVVGLNVVKNNEGVYVDRDSVNSKDGIVYYNYNKDSLPSVTLKLTVIEHNFRAEDVIAKIEAPELTEDEINAIKAYVSNADNWRYETAEGKVVSSSTKAANPDKHVILITLSKEANYNISFDVFDLANKNNANKEKNYATIGKKVTYDKTAPTDVKVTYSDPIGTVWDKIIGKLSYGFYNDSTKCEVTIEATDTTAGIEYFDVALKNVAENATDVIETVDGKALVKINADGTVREGDLGEIKVISASETNGKIVIKLNVPAQFRGAFEVTAYDKSANTTKSSADNKVAIMDTVSPEITVEYAGKEDGTTASYYTVNGISASKVDDFKEATNLFFNGAAQATITLKDANKFEGTTLKDGTVLHNFGILLTKTYADGTTETVEYLPLNSDERYSTDKKVYFNWKKTTEEDTYTFTFSYNEEADYVLTIDYTDFSANDAVIDSADKDTVTKTYVSKVITVDKTAPVIEPIKVVKNDGNSKYSEKNPVGSIGGVDYYNNKTWLKLVVTEHNFCVEDVILNIKATDVAGTELSVDEIEAIKSRILDTTAWCCETTDGRIVPSRANAADPDKYVLLFFVESDANYTISFDVYDPANKDDLDVKNNHTKTKEKKITVDKTAPIDVNVTYSDPIGTVWDKIINNLSYGFYNDSTKCEVTIEATDATAGIEYFDVVLKNVKTSATDVETKKFTLNADGSLRAGELGKITVKSVNKSIVADGEKITITLNVPAQFRGAFDVTAYDKATNKTRYTDEKVAIVDTVAPNIDVKYDKVEKDTIRTYYKNNAIVTKFSEADQVFYNGAAQATITVTDANFFEGVKTENGEILHNIGIFVTKTDAEGKVTIDEYVPTGAELKNSEATKVEFDWKTKNDVHTMVIPYDADADYVLTIDYTDFSENDAVIGSDDKDDATKTYTSKPVTVDTTPAIVKMEFNPAVQTVEEHRYYNEAKKPVTTITVTEHNFYAKYVDIDVTAINKLGDVVIADFKAFAKEDGNWKHDGNVHTLEVPYTVDGTYDIKVSEVKDLAMNVSADKPTDTFTYDTTMPSDVKVTYSDPIGTVWDKIIDSLSYGFYNDETKCDVTIEATDVTAGIEYFGVKLYNVKESATNTGSELEFELNADGTVRKGKLGEITVISVSETVTGKIVIKLNVPAQFRGAFEVTAYDKSTNNASYSDENVAIIDTVAPNINVEYSAVNKDTTASYYIVNGISAENVNSFKDATNLFYNGAAQATITVTDTNFFEGAKTENGEILHNIGIFVTKTDAEGNVTTDEYVPTGAELKNSEATKIEFNWKTENDVHTMVIPYDADADYVLTVEYTDFSENDAVIGSDDKDDVTETYTSKPVTVDTKAPEVEVTYDYVQEDIKNDIDGRKYFDKDQSMTIAITEHNFFVEGADIQILAKNSAGGNANGYNYEEDPAYVVEFIEQALKTGNWYQKSENRNSQGVNNIYYIDINFNVDANYTFDIDYADLATNASVDYVEDKFTVDKVMPECVSVEYSQNVFQEVLQAITFGYYKAPVTVTITATDATSGVFEFTYGYRNANGVSSVNAELLEQIIAEAEVTFSEERQTATTTFSVPKEALTDRTQFNGHIEFLAKDRSGNTSEQYVDNDDRIIVDDIAPTIQVTYNTPAATRNGIHYYTKAANNGAEITGTIVINEANFDWEDVVVTLTKDGSDSNYSRSVTWTDNNVDSHTGRFSVKGDGDYVVKVAYTDKSGNVMETYTSPKMIIDTATPEVTITKLEPGSHNNDETIGFVLTIVDRNIPLKGEKYEDNIKGTFTGAANQGDKGYVYKAPEVQLGTPDVSTDGRITTYTYTIDNLPNDDAFYNLNCQVKDFATNEMNEISWGAVDAQGNKLTTDNVTFSVNRNGSVFWIETKLNGEEADLNGKYINGEVTLILHELNVDKVGEGNDKTALTINDGSKTTTVALNDSTVKKNVIVPEGQGGWYETIYTLDNSYFDHDGVYSINLISYDEAGNSNVNTKSEAGVISYTVDRTKPVIVSNVKTKDIINATEHIVVIKITETNLDENITLEFYDNRGNKVDVEYENLGYNEFSFKVGQVFNHTIKVVAKDYAGNVSDVYQVEEFTVSTSIFVRFYANTTLFWSVVGGAVLLSVGVIAFIILKNKKKED